MCWYGIKKLKNILCLIMVGLLDLRVRRQSDVMGAEMRGVFNDLRVNRFLQCGWCMVSSPPPSLSLSLSLSWSSGPWTVVCFLLICARRRRNLSFISFFSSDRIRLGFLCFFLPLRSLIDRKITFDYFYFLTNFIDISLCADHMGRNPFSLSWRKSQHR